MSEILIITKVRKACTTNVERWIGLHFLGAFRKLRKATIDIDMSVCPHGKTATHWVEFHEILYLSIFSKIYREN